MVIDSSAIVAILLLEWDCEVFIDAIDDDPVRLISSLTALETTIVMEARKGPLGGRELDLFLHRTNVQHVGFGPEHFEMARNAWRKYGKGNHPAALNLGDCCSYALSKISGEPLLFKGDDFTKTDIAAVDPRLTG